MTATVSDPDGGVTATTWVWASSTTGTSNWTTISGANSATYTPTAANVGSYLRATATYTDAAAGAGRTAEGMTASAVAQDDDGRVSLSTSTPRVGSLVSASLSDPDLPVSNVSWAWERSADGASGWTSVLNATSSYTPRQSDFGYYLRASASYTDAVGPGKTASATTGSVAARELVARYDANGDGSIDRTEALGALKDYFDDNLSLAEMVSIIQEYFS